MIRSNLRGYSDAYILVKRTTKVPNTAVSDAAVNNTNKEVIFKDCAHLLIENRKFTNRKW